MIFLKNSILYFLILGISIIPILNSKMHFNLSMITEGYLNKIFLITIIFLLIMENYCTGLFALILLSSLLFMDPSNIAEGFIPYFTNN